MDSDHEDNSTMDVETSVIEQPPAADARMDMEEPNAVEEKMCKFRLLGGKEVSYPESFINKLTSLKNMRDAAGECLHDVAMPVYDPRSTVENPYINDLTESDFDLLLKLTKLWDAAEKKHMEEKTTIASTAQKKTSSSVKDGTSTSTESNIRPGHDGNADTDDADDDETVTTKSRKVETSDKSKSAEKDKPVEEPKKEEPSRAMKDLLNKWPKYDDEYPIIEKMPKDAFTAKELARLVPVTTYVGYEKGRWYLVAAWSEEFNKMSLKENYKRVIKEVEGREVTDEEFTEKVKKIPYLEKVMNLT